MPEVTGTLVVHTNNPQLSALLADLDEGLDEDSLSTWFKLVKISDSDPPACLDTYLEGNEKADGYHVLSLFGEDWIKIIASLLAGQGHHLWATLWHEYGTEYYFALSDDGHVNRAFDREGDLPDDDACAAALNEWLSHMPDPVKVIFAGDS